ncbi:GNAT family N-acetyltransferase [Streptomyces sp. NPDC052496]|uniref:GNAT family N-acetyltransferase n=1 Tax=Streptomyces sp. NPDC052496 TaxID=3154951 RepID=UPI00343C34D5
MTSLKHHDDPRQIAGWDRLADHKSFYVDADWLRFVDSDGGADPHYLALYRGGAPAAGLVAHWNPDEGHPDYRPTGVLGHLDAPGPMVLFGGRRGFCSDVLLPDTGSAVGGPDDLAVLLNAALDNVPEARARWWWPYLPSEAARHVVAAARTVQPSKTPGVQLLGADCIVDLVGRELDDHIDALPVKQQRTNARREIRRFDESGLEVRQSRLSETWEQGAPLLGQVQRKYGHDMSDDRLRGFLRRQAEHLDRSAVVFAVFDGSRLTGFSLCYRTGRELALRLLGLDYPRLREASEYAQLMLYAPLRYCYVNGLTRLHLGTESYDAKCRRGARIRPLWAITSDPPAESRAADDRLGALTEQLPSRAAASLVTEVRTSLMAWKASSRPAEGL